MKMKHTIFALAALFSAFTAQAGIIPVDIIVAGPEAASPSTHYSMAVPDDGTTIPFVQKQARKVIFETTTLPASHWKAMVNAGTAPKADVVKCNASICTYGQEKVMETGTLISLKAVALRDGKYAITFEYDKVEETAPPRKISNGSLINTDLPSLSKVTLNQSFIATSNSPLTLSESPAVKITIGAAAQ